MKNRFNVGDKVRLMSHAADCEVSRIVSDRQIAIRDENGFEYTVNISEIVPLFNSENISAKEQADAQEEIIKQNKSKSLLPFFSNAESLYLCATPENFNALLNTSYKVHLVNASKNIVLYSLQQVNVAEETSSYGVLNAGEEAYAGAFSQGKKPDAVLLQLKCIIHADESKVVERQFSFSPEDFTNEKLFHSPELFRKHILSVDCFAKREIKISEADITKMADHFTSPAKKVVKEKVRGRKNTDESLLLTNEKTVDLHVEELTNDYNHMSNAEIMALQLNHFHKELDKAILNHYYRIIFIHGKGNGVLKGRIRNELDAMNLGYKDADTGKFGFGATEVLL